MQRLKNLARAGKTTSRTRVETIGPGLLDISTLTKEQGFYLPASFMATTTRSKVTYIDSDAAWWHSAPGAIPRQGSSAEKSTFSECAESVDQQRHLAEQAGFALTRIRSPDTLRMGSSRQFTFFPGFTMMRILAHGFAVVASIIRSRWTQNRHRRTRQPPRFLTSVIAESAVRPSPATACKRRFSQQFHLPAGDLRCCASNAEYVLCGAADVCHRSGRGQRAFDLLLFTRMLSQNTSVDHALTISAYRAPAIRRP